MSSYQEALNKYVTEAKKVVDELSTKYKEHLPQEDLDKLAMLENHLQNVEYNVTNVVHEKRRGSYVIDNGHTLHLFATVEEGHKFLGSLAFSYGHNVEEFCGEKHNVSWGIVDMPVVGQGNGNGQTIPVVRRDDDDDDY